MTQIQFRVIIISTMNKISYKNVSIWLILGLSLSFFANSTALAATAKVPAKKRDSKVHIQSFAKKTVKKTVVAKTVKSDDSAKTSYVAPAQPPKNCIQAVLQANRECKVIAGGCYSSSVTPRCIAANQTCAEKQEAALALCP